MAFINFYRILHISTQATSQEIKRAYRHMAKIWHPDRNQGSKSSEEKFKEIQSAYEILSDPSKKRHYDHKYQKELAKDKTERKAPPRKKDFRWQSAQSYQSQLNNLWQQYENLNNDRKRAFGQGFNPKKEKYYYYNNERVSAEEFRAKTQKPPENSQKKNDPHVSVHHIDPYKRKTPWWQQVEIIGMIALFFNLVMFMWFPRQMGYYTIIPLILLALGFILVKWWQYRDPIYHIVIEIRPDCIIRRGKGSVEATLYFEEIKSIKDLSIGMFVGADELPNPSPFSRRMATAYDDIIFIPMAIQNFERIRHFILSLEPQQATS